MGVAGRAVGDAGTFVALAVGLAVGVAMRCTVTPAAEPSLDEEPEQPATSTATRSRTAQTSHAGAVGERRFPEASARKRLEPWLGCMSTLQLSG